MVYIAKKYLMTVMMEFKVHVGGQRMSLQSLFGSRTQADVITALDLANGNALSASTIARLFDLNVEGTYRCLSRLRDLGLVREVTKASGKQKLYQLAKNELTKNVVGIERSIRKKADSSLLQVLTESIQLGRYYFSLPFALRITYDVFYAPNYLLIVSDDDATLAIANEIAAKFPDVRLASKNAPLRGREFYFDKSFETTLASTEQAIADGLNWYSEIRDPELIRVLLATPYRFDWLRLSRLLSDLGKKRAYEILDRRRIVYGESPPMNYLKPMNRNVDSLIKDLDKEWQSILLPNRSL